MGKVLMTILPQHMKIPKLRWIIMGAFALSNISTDVSSVFNRGLLFMDLQAKAQGGSITRYLAEHKIPGREGPIFQDMGGDSQHITITGSWIYENKPNDVLQGIIDLSNNIPGISIGWNWVRLEIMKALARYNMPMILSTNLFIGPVILKKFDFNEIGGQPNVYNYSMVLRELNPALSLIGTAVMSGFQAITGFAGAGAGAVLGALGQGDGQPLLGDGIVRGL